MKKTIQILAVALSFVLLALALVSCGTPNSDPDKAKAALEKNGYTVVKTNGNVTNAVSALLGGDSVIDATVTGTKVVDNGDGSRKVEFISITYYKTADAAKEAWGDAQKDAEDAKTDDSSDWIVARSGKMIYWGTSAAVKAAS